MTVDTGIVLVLTYLLVSAIIFFAFLFVVFALALFIDRWRERRRRGNGEKTSPGRNLMGCGRRFGSSSSAWPTFVRMIIAKPSASIPLGYLAEFFAF